MRYLINNYTSLYSGLDVMMLRTNKYTLISYVDRYI